MPKIIINIPFDPKAYLKKYFHLLIRIKNILILFVVFLLLINSYIGKHTKIRQKKNYSNKINDIKNTKVCICTLGKNENKYIKEFINHYKDLGVDKIILYDNNEIGNKNESFEDEIFEYIKNEFVEIINYKGKIAPQLEIYSECYNKNHKNYDWLIFFDIDEFIHLENYSNIKYFLNEKKFNKCRLIYFNCLRHTDNDLLFYDNRTLVERFPYINWESKLFTLKTIARGNLKNIRFKTTHWLDRRIIGCNVFGKKVIPSRLVRLKNDIKRSEFKQYYIDHYCFKSTEEYVNKVNKGDGIFGFSNKTRMHKIKLYLEYNRISQEKIDYLELKTGLNLSQFRSNLNKSNFNHNNKIFSSLNSKITFYIFFILSFFYISFNKNIIFLIKNLFLQTHQFFK